MILTASLLSLAGIPLTVGFIGKFYVITAGVQQHLWLPVFVLVIASVIGLYYYLRIISTLFADAPAWPPREKLLHPFFNIATYGALITLAFVLLSAGIFPQNVIEIIKQFLLMR